MSARSPESAQEAEKARQASLNLQASADVVIELPDGPRKVRGRAATADERPRLWELWRKYDGENLDSWAARRPGETAVVILEPRA